MLVLATQTMASDHRKSDIGNRESGIGNRELDLGPKFWTLNHRTRILMPFHPITSLKNCNTLI